MPCCAPLLACPCLPPRRKRMSPQASKSLGRSGMMHVPWLTTVPLGHVVLDLLTLLIGLVTVTCIGTVHCLPAHHHHARALDQLAA